MEMKFAVIQFPGSNCDQDCIAAINGLDGLQAEYVWHKETTLDDFDAIVLPGGFAYGLPSLRSHRSVFADHEGSHQRRSRRQARARHLQRLSSVVRGGPVTRRTGAKPLTPLCL